MQITRAEVNRFNQDKTNNHKDQFEFLEKQLINKGVAVEAIVQQIQDFQVAIPSWALD